MRVEIAITGTVDQENSDHESYYVWFDEEKTMSGRVPRSSCTEIPEPIKRGTMVWAMPYGEWEGEPRFYCELNPCNQHLVATSRKAAMAGENYYRANDVRPVCEGDLHGTV